MDEVPNAQSRAQTFSVDKTEQDRIMHFMLEGLFAGDKKGLVNIKRNLAIR